MTQYFDDVIVNFERADGSEWQYYWGDACEVIETGPKRTKIRINRKGGVLEDGFINSKTKLRDTPILKLSMIDVQQGDGLILETPTGKVIFIDGVDNQLFARHAAARFGGTSAASPLIVDAIVVTHGDADHFDGLNELAASETNAVAAKRIFVAPKRYYHNGMVKRPTAGRSETEMRWCDDNGREPGVRNRPCR